MWTKRDAELMHLLLHPRGVPLEPREVEEKSGGRKVEDVGVHRSLIRSDGAQGRDRTTDTVIFSHVLYQLSYLGSRNGRAACASERAP